jgi:hypothetical protein
MRNLSELKTAHYASLSREEWEHLESWGIVNWFWPASHPVLGWILARIAPALKRSSSSIHDFCYWQGGDEARRKECDEGFYLRLVQDSLDTGWKMAYYLPLSFVYFLAVRTMWKKYFKYK